MEKHLNILFLGPYKQNDGWGRASRDYIKALLTTKHNIVTRYLNLHPNSIRPFTLSKEIEQVTNKQLDTIDVVIQNTLPKFFEIRNDIRPHIGLCFFETNNIRYSIWARYLNLMNEIWVPSKIEQQNFENDNINTPTHVIGSPVDLKQYAESYNKEIEQLRQQYNIRKNTFKFYFIGEYIQRKNVNVLLAAFHREFGVREPVDLIIKTGFQQNSPSSVQQKVQNDIIALKNLWRLYKTPLHYKQEIVITDVLSDKHLCALHQIGDCFVMPSSGESICRPAIDAIGFNNIPIGTDNTGMIEFINKNTGYLIQSVRTQVQTLEAPLPDIYTGREEWHIPNILSLQKAMRQAYTLSMEEKKNKNLAGQTIINNFSYTKIGQNMDKHLQLLVETVK